MMPPRSDEALDPPPPAPERLRAGPAIVVLAVFVATQLAVAAAVVVVAMVLTAVSGIDVQHPQVIDHLSVQVMPIAILCGLIGAGVISILVSVVWFRSEVIDPLGAAWRAGDARELAHGLVGGAVLGAAYLALATQLGPQLDTIDAGPLGRMATTPGPQQITWTFLALVIAPPLEELVFRGVLFGGLRRSWGTTWAAAATTVLFVALHGSEVIHFWPAVVGITGVALATLWIRLRTRSIGPAVALHFAYNATLAATVAYSTL